VVDPRNTSTRTTIEKLVRRTVNQAADELLSFLEKLPEHGTPAPVTLADEEDDRGGTDRDITRGKIHRVQRAVARYFGEN